jgi:hypothetical protein
MTAPPRFARRLAVAQLAVTATLFSTRVADPSATFEIERVAEAHAATTAERSFADEASVGEPQRPMHKVPLPHSRVTQEISRTARDLLDRPMGSETILDIDGRAYAFAVERHYHSPESGMTPIGWHKGVTVYALE